MRILLTGASGFLGKYLRTGMNIPLVTLGRGQENDIVCNLASSVPTLPKVDMVVHNAGLAHRIPKNSEEEQEFFRTNLTGTQNLLAGLNNNGSYPQAVVFVSTVAVYGLEKGEMITENYSPKPVSPYAKSKFQAELLLKNWAEKHQINLTILRLPLVAGAIDTPGNLGAMIKAIKAGYYFRIGLAQNKKSLVLAQDVAQLIPNLINTSGIFNLTDGQNPTLAELENYIAANFGKKIKTINPKLLRIMSKIGDKISGFPINSYRISKLSETLTFDHSKAKLEIGWNPRPVIGNLDLELGKK